MEAHTQTHLKQLRELLEYRLAELRADVAAVAGMQIADDIRDAHDQENIAGAQQAAVRDAAQELHDREELESVAAAIGRLDGGVYGDCIECGEPIAFERLFVQPAAVRCARCRAKHEHA
jgi:RNA polymerase-binding transcription factor DksA